MSDDEVAAVVQAATELLAAIDLTEFCDLLPLRPLAVPDVDFEGMADTDSPDGGGGVPLTVGHIRRLRLALRNFRQSEQHKGKA